MPVRKARGTSRHYHLKQRFGLGSDQVEAMILEQGGVCRVCRENPATQVDHDHATGRVRGILCLNCNAGMGAFGDSVHRMYSALDYLKRTAS